MPKFKDRTWERYWRLVVISEAERSEKRKWVRWNCKCDCWNDKIVFSDELSSGKSNSCWCLKYEVLHSMWFQFKKNDDREKQLISYLYRNWKINHRKWYKWNAWNLTIDEFAFLIKQPCHYCWLEKSNYLKDIKWWKKITDFILYYNWLDRVDSNWLYTKNNVVPCCKYCNMAKNDMSKDEFLSHIKRIYEYKIK